MRSVSPMMLLFFASLPFALVKAVRFRSSNVSAIADIPTEDKPFLDGMLKETPRLDAMKNCRVGERGEALIPAWVPREGEEFKLQISENVQALDLVGDTGRYTWTLKANRAYDSMGLVEVGPATELALTRGSLKSNWFGHNSIHVYNGDVRHRHEIFKIRYSRHNFNPFQLRWSFRILPPGSKDNRDALFTINRDVFGNGFMWQKEEWRIYRGRKKDGDKVYYGVCGYRKWSCQFYRSKEARKSFQEPVAIVEQRKNAGMIFTDTWIPDKFTLTVKSGEDTALLLAVSTILDIAHDAADNGGLMSVPAAAATAATAAILVR